MLATLLATALLAWLALSPSARAPDRATRPAGLTWLHTGGTVLRDARGRPVRLVGVNQGGMYEGQGNAVDACGRRWQPPSPQLGANLERWGFNSVRLHISWADLEPAPPTRAGDGTLVHHWNAAYLSAIDGVAADLRRHHVYLIPVMTQAWVSPAFRGVGHQCEGSGMPAWLFPTAGGRRYWAGWCEFLADRAEPGASEGPLEGFIAAWRLLAKRYATDRAVAAFDLLNEPGSAFLPCSQLGISLAPSYLDSFDRRVGTAIRAVNRRAVLIFEDENYSDGPYGHFIRSTAGLRNVVYEWHSYPRTWKAGEPKLAAQLIFARRLNVPLWVGEFDAFGADDNYHRPPDRRWKSDLLSMMLYLRAHGVGWSLQNYDGPFSLTVPGTGRPKRTLLALLQRGVGSGGHASGALDARLAGTLGATPGSAWPRLGGGR